MFEKKSCSITLIKSEVYFSTLSLSAFALKRRFLSLSFPLLSLSPSDKISFRGGVGVAREKGPLQLRAKDQREGPLKGAYFPRRTKTLSFLLSFPSFFKLYTRALTPLSFPSAFMSSLVQVRVTRC